MPKRKSHGRRKGGKGRGSQVQCAGCGQLIARDKAKKVTKWVSFIDYRIAKDLRKQGAYLPKSQVTQYYCVSCAIHRHVVSIRQREDRKQNKQNKERR